MKISEADILGGLTVGNAKSVVEGKKNSPLGNLLVELNQAIIDDLQQSIQARDINASRNLSSGITPSDVIINGNEIEVNISMDFYWKYINYGVNGTEVNRNAPSWGSAPSQSYTMGESLRHWETDRGILTQDGKYTNWISKSKVEGKSLIQRGQKARPFYDDVINDKLVAVLEAPIKKLLGESIKLTIVASWQ